MTLYSKCSNQHLDCNQREFTKPCRSNWEDECLENTLNASNTSKKESLIREYCYKGNRKVKEIYNRIVSAYGDFLKVHSEFIISFIMNPAKKENKDENSIKGTAGTVIKEILLRYESILSQKIKWLAIVNISKNINSGFLK